METNTPQPAQETPKQRLTDRWAFKLAMVGFAIGFAPALGQDRPPIAFMIGFSMPYVLMFGFVGMLIDFFRRKRAGVASSRASKLVMVAAGLTLMGLAALLLVAFLTRNTTNSLSPAQKETSKQPLLQIHPELAAPAPPLRSNALKYPRPPESLAEMNPAGICYLREGVSVKLRERKPEIDATEFGRKALSVEEGNAPRLSTFPRWRALTGAEIWTLGKRFIHSEIPREKALHFYLLRHAARKGHALSQVSLAHCYAWGRGVERDERAAAYWAFASMQNGNAYGTRLLSIFYLEGRGVERNKDKAREMLTLAAQRGDVEAQAFLGVELLGVGLGKTTFGFKPAPLVGRYWVEQAASAPLTDENDLFQRKGKAIALNAMGLMYAYGRAVPKNETEALAFFYLARSLEQQTGRGTTIDYNISTSEESMTSSARQYSQLRAQELRSIYFKESQAPPEPQSPPTVRFGSGVFITPNGHLLTAAHVVGNARRVKAQVGENVLDAEIVAVDPPNDVALLKVNAEVDAAPVRPSAGVALGDKVFTIGFPNRQLQGTEPKFTEGTISSTSGVQDDPRQFQVSVQVQPGNSGGALFDENGNVVGIVVARLDDATTTQLTGSAPQNVNYAVKSSYALPLIESLKAELATEQSPSWFGPKREEIVSRAKHASVPLVVELRTASE